MDKVIGTCSLCGGAVVVFDGPWMGTKPPTPSCSSCGARPKENHGPVIPMEPNPPMETWAKEPPKYPWHLGWTSNPYKHFEEAYLQTIRDASAKDQRKDWLDKASSLIAEEKL